LFLEFKLINTIGFYLLNSMESKVRLSIQHTPGLNVYKYFYITIAILPSTYQEIFNLTNRVLRNNRCLALIANHSVTP